MQIAVVGGGVLTTLVSNLPFVDLVNLLCFAGFWGSAIFAVWVYRRLSGNLTVGEGFRLGALIGLCAGCLGFGLSFLGLGTIPVSTSSSSQNTVSSISSVTTASFEMKSARERDRHTALCLLHP